MLRSTRVPIGLSVILGAVLVAQLADAISFGYGVSRFGIQLEANALMRGAYEVAGFAGVYLFKGAAVAAVVGMLYLARDRFPRFVKLGGIVATAMGLLGALVNSTVIVALSV